MEVIPRLTGPVELAHFGDQRVVARGKTSDDRHVVQVAVVLPVVDDDVADRGLGNGVGAHIAQRCPGDGEMVLQIRDEVGDDPRGQGARQGSGQNSPAMRRVLAFHCDDWGRPPAQRA